MHSASDFFQQLEGCHSELIGVNQRLDGPIAGSLNAINQGLQQLNATLSGDFNQLLSFVAYIAQALYQNDQQNGTIICILEKIAKNTCDLDNQAHLQTALQGIIERNTTALAQLYEMVHAEAALARERERHLRHEIEKCCPPKPSPPPCADQPCPAPKPIGPPPSATGIQ